MSPLTRVIGMNDTWIMQITERGMVNLVVKLGGPQGYQKTHRHVMF
jgi:hypothetical protein